MSQQRSGAEHNVCIYILYYIIFYCIILYFILFYCTVLYYIIFYCIILYYILLYCIILYFLVLYYIILYYFIFYYDTYGQCYLLCWLITTHVYIYILLQTYLAETPVSSLAAEECERLRLATYCGSERGSVASCRLPHT